MLTKIKEEDSRRVGGACPIPDCPKFAEIAPTMPLSELPVGQVGIISHTTHTTFGPGLADRLAALGLVKGRRVEVLRYGAWGGPIHIRVGLTTEIAIRRQEAATIILESVSSGELV